MKKYFTFFLLVIIFSPARSQSLDSMLNIYSDNFPQEKLHFHTDKDTYFPGETIWFKAYILADDLPATVSTNLYVDLLDEKGNLVEHKTMPIIAASADGQFSLPDSAPARHYVLRAYTTWMLNFDRNFIYHKNISVVTNTSVAENKELPEVSLQFFPEGGNFVGGLYNYVAFKAMQRDGVPYAVTAKIKDSKGVLVDSVTSVHDGMGVLQFTPELNETYIAEWKDNKGEYRRTPLPAVQPQGIILHTEMVKNELYYLVRTSGNEEDNAELKLVATMFQKIQYKATIKMQNRNEVTEKILLKDFPTGILQLTIFNKKDQPLVERIVFVNNENFRFNTRINITERNVTKRGKNKIEITIPDTLSSNLSMAVYDANLEQQESNRNIFSDLFLQADIKGYVYNADWYFNDDALNRKPYLDLVMQTNGWRRYNWDKITAGKLPVINYQPDNYLSIFGKATDEKEQPMADQMINLIVQTADSARQWYMPVTGKDGLFRQAGLIFYDTATVLYKINNSKEKANRVGISNNGLSIVNLGNYIPQGYLSQTMATGNEHNATFLTALKNYDPEFEKKSKLLNAVVVKSKGRYNWKNDPIQKTDEKYAGLFRGIGPNSYAFDVMHDEKAASKFDVFNYIIGKVPRVNLKWVNGVKTLDGITDVYVDELEIPREEIYSTLSSLQLSSIGYIKTLSPNPMKQGFGTALLIYSKKNGDYVEEDRKLPSSLSKIKVAGYSPTKEFYSPDYAIPDDRHSSADLRTTLYWQPYILTSKNNKQASISFYNNDISTRLKVVIEGVNEEGKMIHFEKIIE